MIENIKNFVEKHVVPNYGKEKQQKDDCDIVDPFGNFEIVFLKCKCSEKDIEDNSSAIQDFNFLLNNGETIHQYIKAINDVELSTNKTTLDLPAISYGLQRLMPMVNSKTITMTWMNTQKSFIETIFIPWMQDNTIKNVFPMKKADLEITFPKILKKKIIYKYFGIRPVECGLHKMTNEPVTDFYRKVTFDFDYFYVYLKD